MRSAEQKAAERGTCTVHRLDDKIRLGLRHEALNRRVVLLREELLVGRLIGPHRLRLVRDWWYCRSWAAKLEQLSGQRL